MTIFIVALYFSVHHCCVLLNACTSISVTIRIYLVVDDEHKGGAEFMEVNSTSFVIDTDVEADNLRRMDIVEAVIAFIREANELLQQEIDLSPANQRVVDIVSRLSARLRAGYFPEEIEAILDNEYIRMNLRSLQHKLSEAECLAELDASRHICQTKQAVIADRLPNWNIYMELVGKELSILRQLSLRDGRADEAPIVFVGSGSLPLSAIILHLCGNAEVICVELDAAAYKASRALLKCLGLSNEITVVMMDGADFNYSSYKRIFVASLVQNKEAVLEQINRTASDPLVAVRTAEGIKQMMYESIDEARLNRQGWTIAARTRPDDQLVINSTLFLKRAACGERGH